MDTALAQLCCPCSSLHRNLQQAAAQWTVRPAAQLQIPVLLLLLLFLLLLLLASSAVGCACHNSSDNTPGDTLATPMKGRGGLVLFFVPVSS